MSKPEWGTKRTCLSCGAKFYDLRKSPIVCPSCGATYDPEGLAKPRRTRNAKPAKPEPPAPKKAKAAEEADAELEAEGEDIADLPDDDIEIDDSEDDSVLVDVDDDDDDDGLGDVVIDDDGDDT